jgi:hypothetical protein
MHVRRGRARIEQRDGVDSGNFGASCAWNGQASERPYGSGLCMERDYIVDSDLEAESSVGLLRKARQQVSRRGRLWMSACATTS